MLIRSILHTKGAAVVTIDATASVLDAAQRLAQQQVGALVVSNDGEHIDGIVSEHDVAWAIAAHGPGALHEQVRAVMTAEVETCQLDDTVDHLMAVMTERRIRHVPVEMGSRLVGIVSIGDVVKHRLAELQTETDALHEYISTGR